MYATPAGGFMSSSELLLLSSGSTEIPCWVFFFFVFSFSFSCFSDSSLFASFSNNVRRGARCTPELGSPRTGYWA